jgi:serine-type D-Ala-D-Ala carboxypeptidase/endopeptidase (penicillin-binding protein 4)
MLGLVTFFDSLIKRSTASQKLALPAAASVAIPAALSLAILSSLAACAPSSGAGELMKIEPGEKGVFLAVGTDVEMTLSSSEIRTGDFEFQVTESDTKGISIGTAIQLPGETRKNESQLFIPASITKLVTASLAIKKLGPAFRFVTEARWDELPAAPGVARDLTIYADGDPQVAHANSTEGHLRSRLKELVAGLKQKGVNKIVGRFRLVPTDPRKLVAVAYPGIMDEDHLACYGALAQAFNYRGNCSILSVSGLNKATWSDTALNFPIQLALRAGERRAVSALPLFDATGAVQAFRIQGTWSESGRTPSFALPISDASAWFGNALLREMSLQGIDVSGVRPMLPDESEMIELIEERDAKARASVRILSDPLNDLVRWMNKPSDNLLADALFKALAEREPGRHADLREAGAVAVREGVTSWMKRHGRPDFASEISLLDGSGLSRDNRASPRAFLALLSEFSKEPGFASLWESLPIAGRDGTLKQRMKGTAAEGVARAKTGSLRGAYQLAGYIPRLRPSGEVAEYIPFVILSQTTPENRYRVHAFQDDLVAKLVRKVNGPLP